MKRTSKRSFCVEKPTNVKSCSNYSRLTQMNVNYNGRDNFNNDVRICSFKSLVSNKFCQWSVMRFYFCYSGNKENFVRNLPLSKAIKIELFCQLQAAKENFRLFKNRVKGHYYDIIKRINSFREARKNKTNFNNWFE